MLRFLHLSAAAIWIGGQALLLLVAPAIRAETADASSLLGSIGRRFGLVSIPSLFILLGTGVAQANHLGLMKTWEVQEKMTTLGLIIVLTFAHAAIGIKVSRGEVAEGSSLRRYGRWISLVNFLLGLSALWAAASLATNH